jgi:hypothetical protein
LACNDPAIVNTGRMLYGGVRTGFSRQPDSRLGTCMAGSTNFLCVAE